jgi:hypothetical protein
VKYLDMGLLTNATLAKSEMSKLSRRDLVILDDLHRSPSLSIQLMNDIKVDAVCNLIGVTRKHFMENPSVKKILKNGSWLEVQTKPMDEIQELIVHRLRARNL